MKTIYTIVAATLLAGALSAAAADYTQNFDSMGTSGTTAPSGWSSWFIAGDSLSVAIPSSAEMATATNDNQTLVLWNQTQASAEWTDQLANEAATATSLNRLLGTSPTGTRGGIIQFNLNNNFGRPITSVSLSYDMQVMAAGVLKAGFTPGAPEELPGYSFFFLDGSTWTHVAALDRTTTGTASGTFSYSSPVANGGTMQFRWYDDNAISYSPDTMYAIDNISLTIPEPATLSLLALGALALISRRCKA